MRRVYGPCLRTVIVMMITILSLILATTLATTPSVPYWPSACGYAAQERGLNFPVSSASPKTEISHSTAVEWGGEPVGGIFQTAEGRLYYQDGSINPNGLLKKQSPDVSNAVTSFLGIRYSTTNIQNGSIYPLTGSLSVATLKSGFKIVIHSCY